MKTLLLSLVLAAVAAAPKSDPAADRIRGEWRGASHCTNLELTPSCKEESVRYVFSGPVAGKYHCEGDKLVGKNYQSMGDLEFTYDAKDSSWTSMLDMPGCKTCRWSFHVQGSRLTGVLTEGAQDTTRKVTATRFPR